MKKIIIPLLLILILSFNFSSATTNQTGDFDIQLEKLEDEFNSFFKLTDQHEREQQLKYVLEKADELIEKYPENTDAYDAVCTIYIVLAEYHQEPLKIFEKGEQYAKRMNEIAPDNGRSYFWMAAFMGEIGQEKGILNSLFNVRPMRNKLEKAIEMEPDFAPAYDVMAQLYKKAPGWPLSIGSMSKALEYREKSVEYDPYNFEYLWYLYEYYLKARKNKNARQVLEKIIAIPEEKEAEFYYGEDIRQNVKEKAQRELENRF